MIYFALHWKSNPFISASGKVSATTATIVMYRDESDMYFKFVWNKPINTPTHRLPQWTENYMHMSDCTYNLVGVGDMTSRQRITSGAGEIRKHCHAGNICKELQKQTWNDLQYHRPAHSMRIYSLCIKPAERFVNFRRYFRPTRWASDASACNCVQDKHGFKWMKTQWSTLFHHNKRIYETIHDLTVL